jgi:hypothetical protein
MFSIWQSTTFTFFTSGKTGSSGRIAMRTLSPFSRHHHYSRENCTPSIEQSFCGSVTSTIAVFMSHKFATNGVWGNCIFRQRANLFLPSYITTVDRRWIKLSLIVSQDGGDSQPLLDLANLRSQANSNLRVNAREVHRAEER